MKLNFCKNHFLFLLFVLLPFITFSQELTKQQKKRLQKLEIDFMKMENHEQVTLLQTISEKERLRRKNKIWGYSLGGIGLYGVVTGSVLLIESDESSIGTVFGATLFLDGLLFGTGSFFTFRTAKRRANERDQLIGKLGYQ